MTVMPITSIITTQNNNVQTNNISNDTTFAIIQKSLDLSYSDCNNETCGKMKEEIFSLSFEDAKQIAKEISNKQTNLQLDSLALLQATSFTNDELFNESLFNTMKSKIGSFDAYFYLEETKHNMEYSEGRRKFPWPNLYVEEAQGNYSPLSDSEIKNIDINKYLTTMIQEYQKLSLNLPYYYERDQVEQSLEDLKNIQKTYTEKEQTQKATLEYLTRNNKPNIFTVQ